MRGYGQSRELVSYQPIYNKLLPEPNQDMEGKHAISWTLFPRTHFFLVSDSLLYISQARTVRHGLAFREPK